MPSPVRVDDEALFQSESYKRWKDLQLQTRSSYRRIVENAFGILANRFCCPLTSLLTILQQEPEIVNTIVLACVCLHNMMRLRFPGLQNADLYFSVTWSANGRRTVAGWSLEVVDGRRLVADQLLQFIKQKLLGECQQPLKISLRSVWDLSPTIGQPIKDMKTFSRPVWSAKGFRCSIENLQPTKSSYNHSPTIDNLLPTAKNLSTTSDN